MKKYILILLIIFLFNTGNAQNANYGFNFSLGYNSYDLNSLKEFLYYSGKTYQDNFIPVRVTKDFPNYLSGKIEFYLFNDIGRPPYAFFVEYFHTPGKIKFEDPSLKVESSFTLSSLSIGPIVEKSFRLSETGFLLLQLRPALLFNYLTIDESLSGTDEAFSETYNFESISFGIGLFVSYKKYFNPYSIQPYLGYQITTEQALHLEDKSSAKIKNWDNKSVPAEWKGFRLGITMGVEW